MKKIFVLALVIVFQVQCLAQSIQISAPEVSTIEFNAYYETHKELGKTYVDYYTEQNPGPANIENLSSLYEKASSYFLAHSKSQAKALYQKIVDLDYTQDWPSNQRMMVFNSLLHLSEIEIDREDEFLNQAATLDPTFEPSSNLFSKELIGKFNKTKSELSKNAFNLKLDEFKIFDKMLVNGRDVKLDSNSQISILPGTYRVTFLSNKYKPLTFIFSSQQLMVLNTPAIPFAEGTCQNPSLNDSFFNLGVNVYYPNCAKQFKTNNSNVVSENANPTQLNLTSLHVDPVQSEPFYKKTWFLLALGTVAGYFIVTSLNHHPRPTSEVVQ